MCPERAAPGIGAVGVDALAALAEDAGPHRCEPGEIGPNELAVVGWIEEFDPLTWEVEVNFRHDASLGARTDTPRR